MDVKSKSEVDIETGIWQLFVVVWRQTADFIVQTRKDEMASFDGRQSEEKRVARRDFEMFHHHLK